MSPIDDTPGDGRPVVVDRRQTPRGELVLRRAGEHFEVIANGTFLMDTRDGRSERALVREAVPAGEDMRVLLGGLGVGFSLDEALGRPGVTEVVVVELEPAVVEWARSRLRGRLRHGLDDRRVRLVVADLRDALVTLDGQFDAICLDIDNGPGWLVHPANADVYADAGLDRLGRLLRPWGRLTVWAAAADAAFEARLRRHFQAVQAMAIPVSRGPDDVVYVAGALRRPSRRLSPSTSL
jgi:spermidine synthase